MKAIIVHKFGGPDVLKYEDAPDATPGPGQIRIAVRAVGVNPVEAYVRTGTYAANKPNLPYTPGSDAAGIVDAVGADVTGFSVGDRVYTGHLAKGAYAEKLIVAADAAYPFPDNISYAEAASLGVPYATAYRGLVQRGRGEAGETLLVHGASGAVGLAAVQMARALGLTIFGTASTLEGQEAVRAAGAHAVFNHKEDGYLDRAKAQANGGAGFDLILEMAAHINLGRDLPALAPHGRVVVIGNRGPVEINARDGMGKDADILPMTLFNAQGQDLKAIHAAIYAGLQNGTLRPVVAREMPLSEAAQAHKDVMDEGGHAPGKIILVP